MPSSYKRKTDPNELRGGALEDALYDKILAALPELFANHPTGLKSEEVMEWAGSSYERTCRTLRRLHKDGYCIWSSRGQRNNRKTLRPARNPPLPVFLSGSARPPKRREEAPAQKVCTVFNDGRIMTRRLMGDPPPGRTPWAAP